MESFNLGGIVFVLVLVLWVAYAVPRIAERRDVMGSAHEAERAHDSTTARELRVDGRLHRSRREVTSPMSENRLLLRGNDPTARPRFDARPAPQVDVEAHGTRHRGLLRSVLLGLVALTVLTTVTAVAGWTPPVLVALPVVALIGLVIGLRRAELSRRTALRRAAERHAEKEWAGRPSRPEVRRAAEAPAIEAAHQDAVTEQETEPAPAATPVVAKPGEWTPRPVPVPRYALHGDVEDLGDRHRAHNRTVQAASVPLERADLEAVEADLEQRESRRGPGAAPATSGGPALDLNLDDVLARRRA